MWNQQILSNVFLKEKNGRRYNKMVFDSHGNSKRKIGTKMQQVLYINSLNTDFANKDKIKC